MARARFYAGVFLITSSTLMLQLIETRIFSVVTWYQLAFLAATLAVAMSITFGIMATILLGAVCYLVPIPAAVGIGFRVGAPSVSP